MRVKMYQSASKKLRKTNNWFKILSEFADSSDTVIQLTSDPGEYASARTLQSVACTAIHRYKFPMGTIREGEQVYIVKIVGGSDE